MSLSFLWQQEEWHACPCYVCTYIRTQHLESSFLAPGGLYQHGLHKAFSQCHCSQKVLEFQTSHTGCRKEKEYHALEALYLLE
jgi:hypothetical protein